MSGCTGASSDDAGPQDGFLRGGLNPSANPYFVRDSLLGATLDPPPQQPAAPVSRGGGGGGAKKKAGPTVVPPSGPSGADCLICASDNVSFLAVGPCDHAVCSLCALRLRVKNHDKKCALCKQEMDTMVVFPARHSPPPFASFDVTSSALEAPVALPRMEWDPASGIMFVDCKRHSRDMEALRSNVCPAPRCAERFPTEALLLKHLAAAHGQHLCPLCLEHQSLFLSEHRLMNEAQLKAHLKAPAFGKDKAGGHPLCQFCDERFFDAQALYRHMRGRHESCPLCPAVHQHRFYETLDDLDDHLRAEHLVCPHCDAATDPSHRGGSRLITFTSHGEYTSHMLDLHGVRAPAVITNFRMGASSGAGQQGDRGGDRGDRGGGRRGGRGGQASSGAARYLDLDVTSDDPTRNARVGGSGRGNRNGTFDTAAAAAAVLAATTFPCFSGGEDDGAILIPANYRIAGSISGAGTFTRNASASAIEAASSAAHEAAAEKARRQQASRKVNMGDFPALATDTSSSAGRVSGAASRGGVAAAPKIDHSPHPLSIMHATQREAARARQAEQDEAQRRNETEERLHARNHLLAESFGVNLDPFRESPTAASSSSSAPPSLNSFLRRPLFTSFILQWTRKNRGSTQLPRIEKALQNFFAAPGQASLQLKPMEAGPRTVVHMLARYYGLNSQEYDPEPRRYVSLVRGTDSAVPSLLLSAAALLPQFDFTPALLRVLESPVVYFCLLNGYFQRLAGSASADRGFAVPAPTVGLVVNRVRGTLSRRGMWRLCPIVSVKVAGPSGLGLEFASLEAANLAYQCLKYAEAPLGEAAGSFSLLDLFDMEAAFEPIELPEQGLEGQEAGGDWGRSFGDGAAEMQGVMGEGGADRTVLSARGFLHPQVGKQGAQAASTVPDSWEEEEEEEDGGGGVVGGEAKDGGGRGVGEREDEATSQTAVPRASSRDGEEDRDWRESRVEDGSRDEAAKYRAFDNNAGTGGERRKLDLAPRSLPPPLPPLPSKLPAGLLLRRPPPRKPAAPKQPAQAPRAANSFAFLVDDSDDEDDDEDDQSESEESDNGETKESVDAGVPPQQPQELGESGVEVEGDEGAAALWVEATDGWSCAVCTFGNVAAFLTCEMCSSPRPHADVLDDEGWIEAS